MINGWQHGWQLVAIIVWWFPIDSLTSGWQWFFPMVDNDPLFATSSWTGLWIIQSQQLLVNLEKSRIRNGIPWLLVVDGQWFMMVDDNDYDDRLRMSSNGYWMPNSWQTYSSCWLMMDSDLQGDVFVLPVKNLKAADIFSDRPCYDHKCSTWIGNG